MKRNLKIMIAVLALALATLACSTNGFSFGKNGATITINLNENQVNTMLANSKDNVQSSDHLLNDITSVDFQDGKIRLFGTYTRPDGSEGNGSFDVTLSTNEGALESQIVAVDMEGVSLDDPRIVRLNEEVTKGLTESAQQTNGEVVFQSAEVTEDGLKLVVQVKVQIK